MATKYVTTRKGRMYLYDNVFQLTPKQARQGSFIGIGRNRPKGVKGNSMIIASPVASSPYIQTKEGQKIPKSYFDQLIGQKLGELNPNQYFVGQDGGLIPSDSSPVFFGKPVNSRDIPPNSTYIEMPINVGQGVGAVTITAGFIITLVILGIIQVGVVVAGLGWLGDSVARAFEARADEERMILQQKQVDLAANIGKSDPPRSKDVNNDGKADVDFVSYGNGDEWAFATNEVGKEFLGGDSKQLKAGYSMEDALKVIEETQPWEEEPPPEEPAGIGLPVKVAVGAFGAAALIVGGTAYARSKKKKKGRSKKKTGKSHLIDPETKTKISKYAKKKGSGIVQKVKSKIKKNPTSTNITIAVAATGAAGVIGYLVYKDIQKRKLAKELLDGLIQLGQAVPLSEATQDIVNGGMVETETPTYPRPEPVTEPAPEPTFTGKADVPFNPTTDAKDLTFRSPAANISDYIQNDINKDIFLEATAKLMVPSPLSMKNKSSNYYYLVDVYREKSYNKKDEIDPEVDSIKSKGTLTRIVFLEPQKQDNVTMLPPTMSIPFLGKKDLTLFVTDITKIQKGAKWGQLSSSTRKRIELRDAKDKFVRFQFKTLFT